MLLGKPFRPYKDGDYRLVKRFAWLPNEVKWDNNGTLVKILGSYYSLEKYSTNHHFHEGFYSCAKFATKEVAEEYVFKNKLNALFRSTL
jgi:hypothetical protein